MSNQVNSYLLVKEHFYVLKVPVLKNVICYIGQFSIVYFAADASIGFWGFRCATKFGWVDIVAESIPEMTSVYILIIRLFTLTLFVPVVMVVLNKLKGLFR